MVFDVARGDALAKLTVMIVLTPMGNVIDSIKLPRLNLNQVCKKKSALLSG